MVMAGIRKEQLTSNKLSKSIYLLKIQASKGLAA